MSGRWSWWDTWRQDLENCRSSVEDAFGCIGAHRNDLRSINGRLDALQTQLSGLETAFSEIQNNQETLKLHLERLVVLSTMWCDEQIESLQSDAYIRDMQLNRLQCSCVQLGTVQQELGDVTHVLVREMQRSFSGLQVEPQRPEPERVASRSPRRVSPRSHQGHQRISSGLAQGSSGLVQRMFGGVQQMRSSPVIRPTANPVNSRICPTQAPDLSDLESEDEDDLDTR